MPDGKEPLVSIRYQGVPRIPCSYVAFCYIGLKTRGISSTIFKRPLL